MASFEVTGNKKENNMQLNPSISHQGKYDSTILANTIEVQVILRFKAAVADRRGVFAIGLGNGWEGGLVEILV